MMASIKSSRWGGRFRPAVPMPNTRATFLVWSRAVRYSQTRSLTVPAKRSRAIDAILDGGSKRPSRGVSRSTMAQRFARLDATKRETGAIIDRRPAMALASTSLALDLERTKALPHAIAMSHSGADAGGVVPGDNIGHIARSTEAPAADGQTGPTVSHASSLRENMLGGSSRGSVISRIGRARPTVACQRW